MTGPDLDSLRRLAELNARAQGGTVDAVLKELLHYEILQAMLETDVFQALTFRGGTALRLCYRGERYSEDLDFVCGTQFDPGVLGGLGDVLAERIGRLYGLEVELGARTPTPGSGVQVGRWRAKVQVHASDRSIRQANCINIGVAAVPAYTRELLRVQPSIRELPASYCALLVPTESLAEIAADKVVAFGARNHLKHGDVWDLWSLGSRGVQAPFELVGKKLDDYGIDPVQFAAGAQARLAEILDPGYRAVFVREMQRFADQRTFALLVRGELVGSMLKVAAAILEPAISAAAGGLGGGLTRPATAGPENLPGTEQPRSGPASL
ncbi:MAG: nucleotidyl transferase AbiEii/AbiGii toxin family protein [Nitrospiraceae bacterium]|nr:nucleotidyl transferase AbiEii/AbiGii toxin family protein [Nitrospiraceae bacterium]MDA8209036.1 nucleotidyl transferase AbiEii/AbiGii toxin family protein [Actinomycetota bacterium]